jgi:hypothetical protein
MVTFIFILFVTVLVLVGMLGLLMMTVRWRDSGAPASWRGR